MKKNHSTTQISTDSRVGDLCPIDILTGEIAVEVTGVVVISLRLGFRRNFLSVLHPNLVSSPIQDILEIFNLTPPGGNSDGYFGMDGLCQIKCR